MGGGVVVPGVVLVFAPGLAGAVAPGVLLVPDAPGVFGVPGVPVVGLGMVSVPVVPLVPEFVLGVEPGAGVAVPGEGVPVGFPGAVPGVGAVGVPLVPD